MIESSLSRRYTKALFELAREAGQEEKIGQEIESFLQAYAGSQLQTVLTNPAFGMDSRKRALEATMLDRLSAVLHGMSGKEIVMHQEIDPRLIGGVLLEFEGKVFDGSVRTQLENMKQRIARGY